jgi:hypothetical protein
VSTTASTQLDSFSSGTITFHRTNGLVGSGIKYISYAIDNQYNNAYTANVVNRGSNFPRRASPALPNTASWSWCSFKHNDVYYAGIEFYIAAAELSVVVDDYVGNFEPFGFVWYDTQNSTILDTEFSNSVSYTTPAHLDETEYAETVSASFVGSLQGNATSASEADALKMPRKNETANKQPGKNKISFREVETGNTGLPTNAYYYIQDMEGLDTNYAVQMAYGETANDVYYRRYVNGTWGDWSCLTNPSNKVSKTGDTMSGTLTFTTTNAIAYTGTRATYNMIKFKDNTDDTYGNGLILGGGGLTVVGGGESADAVAGTYTSGGSENLDLASDGSVTVWTNVQAGVTSTDVKKFIFDATGSVKIPSIAYVNTASSGSDGGLSIYGGSTPTSYGITMRQTGSSTGQLGKHGYVQGDWACYLNFHGNNMATRGWIFRDAALGNVASISTQTGNAVFNGSVTIGGNSANTSGCRLTYNSTTQSCDFVFA